MSRTNQRTDEYGGSLIANPDWAEKVRQGHERALKSFDPAQLAELH